VNQEQGRRAAFIHSADLEKYSYPPDCPFDSQRAGRTYQILSSMNLLAGPELSVQAPRPAARDVLEKFHLPPYLDALRRAADGDLGVDGLYMALGTPDCPVFEGMYDYAVLACGATLTGADLILRGKADVAFNPSGGYHHAGPGNAAGFCYINDVVLGCMELADRGKRVFYLDVDVHHGDGVQDAFYDRRDVMTLSFHESGRTLFPGTGFEDEIGVGDGEGFCANVPLPPETYDEAYLKAFREVALPLIGAFGPDVIVLELGMDALAGDPLAHLKLTNNAYADLIGRVLEFGRPILATGGGGYHVQNTARGWALAWSVFRGGDEPHDVSAVGGVMLESTEWQGGLRDRMLVPSSSERAAVEHAVDKTVELVRKNVFGLHGL